MGILSRLHGGTDRDTKPGNLHLAVGLNRVDDIVPGGWTTSINQPTEEAAQQINRKCSDIKRLLVDGCGISPKQVEYYSALRRYRTEHLLNCVIRNCNAGFVWSNIDVPPFEDVADVDPEARAFVKAERSRRAEEYRKKTGRQGVDINDALLADLAKIASPSDLKTIEKQFREEEQTPRKVAVIGQSGVGKTTTVNALFAADWHTSDIEVGTHVAQQKTVELRGGGSITVTDLPGYGRTLAEDEKYEPMYRQAVADCDLVLLIIQADRGDFADDQEMIQKIVTWML